MIARLAARWSSVGVAGGSRSGGLPAGRTPPTSVSPPEPFDLGVTVLGDVDLEAADPASERAVARDPDVERVQYAAAAALEGVTSSRSMPAASGSRLFPLSRPASRQRREYQRQQHRSCGRQCRHDVDARHTQLDQLALQPAQAAVVDSGLRHPIRCRRVAQEEPRHHRAGHPGEPARLVGDPPADLHSRRHGENRRDRRDPRLDESGGRTFHVVSERLAERFSPAFRRLTRFRRPQVTSWYCTDCAPYMNPIRSPLQPPDPPAARHHTPCRSRN